jgi:hypothetical protein
MLDLSVDNLDPSPAPAPKPRRPRTTGEPEAASYNVGAPAALYPIPGAGDAPLDLTPGPAVTPQAFASFINSVFGGSSGTSSYVGDSSGLPPGMQPGFGNDAMNQAAGIDTGAAPASDGNQISNPFASLAAGMRQAVARPDDPAAAAASVKGKLRRQAENPDRNDALNAARSANATRVSGQGDQRLPGTPGLGYASGRVQPMRPAEYRALTDRQQGAVDFNTLMAKAARRDINQQENYNPSADEKKEYDATLKGIFGEDGGSQTYAPETLALLRQIMYEDQGGDIDDFLNMNMAVTAGALTTVPELQEGNPAADILRTVKGSGNRVGSQSLLAANTKQVQEQVAKGTELLHSITAMTREARNDDIKGLGGIERPVKERLGYAENAIPEGSDQIDLDGDFRKIFETITLPENRNKRDQILNEIKPKLENYEKGTFDKLLKYIANRNRIELTYGLRAPSEVNRENVETGVEGE